MRSRIDSLRDLKEAIELEWSDAAKFHLVVCLIQELSLFPTREAKSLVFQIAVRTKPSPEATWAFEVITNPNPLHFKLYRFLGLEANTEVLSKLVETYTVSVPKFKDIKLPLGELCTSKHLAGAVYVCKPYPNEELLSLYLNYLDTPLQVLWKPTLGQVSFPMFREVLFRPLKRLMIRSPQLLNSISRTFSYLTCDLSGIAASFIFPDLFEYLFQDKFFARALELFRVVCSKCQDLSEVVSQMSSQKDLNESQAYILLTAVTKLDSSKVPDTQALLNYVYSLSFRVKSESKKHIIAQAIDPYLEDGTIETFKPFILAHAHIPAFTNLVEKLNLQDCTRIEPTSNLNIAMQMSLKVPCPLPAKLKSFLQEDHSTLYSLLKKSEQEALAVSRFLVNALNYSDSYPLIKAYSSSLCSRFPSVRNYSIQHWYSHPQVLKELKGVPLGRKLLRTVLQNIHSSEMASAFAEWVTSDGVFSQKLLHYILKNHIEAFKEFQKEDCLKGEKIIAFEMMTNCYEQLLSQTKFYISYQTFEFHIKRKKFLQRAELDPNFEEISELNYARTQVLQEVGIQGDFQNKNLVAHAIQVSWEQAIERAKQIFRGFTLSLKLRNTKHLPKALKNNLYFEVLETALQDFCIPELRSEIWDLVTTLFWYSFAFKKASHDFAHCMLKSSINIWSEKHLRKCFDYTTNSINIQTLDPAEAHVLEKLVLWVLKQSPNALRNTAVSLLINFVYSRQFSDLNKVVLQVVCLLQNYSGPNLSSLFSSLLPVMTTDHWKSFMSILLDLQPTVKKVFLSNLAEFQEDIPNEDWAVTPIWICLQEETISHLAKCVWKKFNFKMTEDILKHQAVKYLFWSNKEIQQMTAKAIAKKVKKHPGLCEVVIEKATQEFVSRPKWGFALLLKMLIDCLDKSLTLHLLEFIIDTGLTFPSKKLNISLLEVAVELVNNSQPNYLDEIFTLLQRRTNSLEEGVRNTAVIMLGFLAGFYNKEDYRIESTIELLLGALDISSEIIPYSVSLCLPKLVSFRTELVPSLLKSQFGKLLSEVSFERKIGPGYGVAAIVKGGGLKVLTNQHILEQVQQVIQNKKAQDWEKEGILVLVEGLGKVLGSSVEPYLQELLPFVIDSLSSKTLQSQASRVIKALIPKLSVQGMKVLLQVVADESEGWKRRIGGIEALGKLGYCRGRQLSLCLPQALPHLMRAFGDTNVQVKEAATKAFKDIASVINNPEILEKANLLARGLLDETALGESLQALLDTQFVHYLDAASLSLVIPLVEMGVKCRYIEIKKQASQVVGGISSVIPSVKEISPYLDRIQSSVKIALSDSVPEVRNFAAQNFGKFYSEVVQKGVPEWLEDMLEAPNFIERSGAVQAYSEILMRTFEWELKLEELLNNCQSNNQAKRESYLGVCIFICWYKDFSKYLERSLPVFFESFKHENEEVRKIAVRLVQVVIKKYFKSHLGVIMQRLEESLFNSDWRVRNSCLSVAGLVLEITDIRSRRKKKPLLSEYRKNMLLVSVYILRFDHCGSTPEQATHIWKNHKSYNKHLVLELCYELLQKLLDISQTSNSEVFQIGIDCLEKLLPKHTTQLLDSVLKVTETRTNTQKLAVVFRKISETAEASLLNSRFESIVKVLGRIVSSDAVFAEIFQIIYTKTKNKHFFRALEPAATRPECCRELLKFEQDELTKAVIALIMNNKEKVRVLKSVVDIAADKIVGEMTSVFSEILTEVEKGKLLETLQILVSSLSCQRGVQAAFCKMHKALSPRNFFSVLDYFCSETTIDFKPLVKSFMEYTILAMHSKDPVVVGLISKLLEVLVSEIPKEDLCGVLHLLNGKLSENQELPVIQSSEGLGLLDPVVEYCLVSGEAGPKEFATRSYYGLIQRTSSEALEKRASYMAGPLIKELNNFVPSDVKMGILDVLHLLLVKVPLEMLVFFPQLETSFLKALKHSEASVREAAQKNLLALADLDLRNLVFKLTDLSAEESLETCVLILQKHKTDRKQILNCILTQLDRKPSKKALGSLGRILALLFPHSESLIQLIPNQPQFYPLLKHYLEQEVSTDGLESYFSVGFNYPECFSMLSELALAKPLLVLQLVKQIPKEFTKSLCETTPALLAIPGKLYMHSINSLKTFLAVLVEKYLSAKDTYADLVKHVFSIDEKGLNNVLKVLYLLSPSYQQAFRKSCIDLYNL